MEGKWCDYYLRKRKDEMRGKRYSLHSMTATLFSPKFTVAQTLQTCADTSAVLIARKTACVGCSLARFCTLEDVAKAYQIPLEELLGELEKAGHTHPQTLIGAQNG